MFTMEDAMVIAIILAIAAIGFLCWLLFTLAIYALPLFVGVLAGQWAYASGAGIVGGLALGLVGAVATFVVGQMLLVSVRSPVVRTAVALLFVAPAAVAGFSAAHGLAKIGVPSEVWRDIFGVVGALTVGAAAWARLTSTGVLAADDVRKPVNISVAPN
jgi:hypothetical protein